MPRQQPQTLRDFIQRRLQQTEAIDGGAEDRHQIGVVGLVAWIDSLAVLLRGEGMNHPRLESGRGKGAFHHVVITSGPLEGHNLLSQTMSLSGSLQLHHRYGKVSLHMRQFCRGKQDSPIEVTEHPLRSRLRTIHTHDAKMLWPHALHAIVQLPLGLVDKAPPFRILTSRPCLGEHVGLPPRTREWKPIHFPTVAQMAISS